MTNTPRINSSSSLQKFYFWGLLPAVLLVPLWIGFFRVFFGAGGWLLFITLFVFAPIVFIIQLLLLLLNIIAERSHSPKMVSKATAIVLSLYYAAIFLWGLTIVDSGGTSGSTGSILSKLLGDALIGASGVLSVLGGFFAIVFAGCAIVTSAIHIAVSKRRY